MKIIKLLSLLFIVAFLTSCMTVAEPSIVTKNPIGTKVGTASRTIYFGMAFDHTDCSIMKAAENGNITKICSVDHNVTKKGIRTTYTTTVTGE